ncbi:MAG: N-acetyltransferase [Clostridia bacterium]|nr:N-acetyltransferase [Clostridia bacterium]
MEIRETMKWDVLALLGIYNYYVENSTATFHLKKLGVDEFSAAFWFTGTKSGTYTVLDEDRVIGYCTLGPFNNKEAYDRSAYVSIYLEKDSTGRGRGAEILDFLEKKAIEKGLHSLIALICSENKRSSDLFLRKGYRLVGELKQAGEKFGRLLDVVYFQKLI